LAVAVLAGDGRPGMAAGEVSPAALRAVSRGGFSLAGCGKTYSDAPKSKIRNPVEPEINTYAGE
jgi:hypothetical protein